MSKYFTGSMSILRLNIRIYWSKHGFFTAPPPMDILTILIMDVDISIVTFSEGCNRGSPKFVTGLMIAPGVIYRSYTVMSEHTYPSQKY